MFSSYVIAHDYMQQSVKLEQDGTFSFLLRKIFIFRADAQSANKTGKRNAQGHCKNRQEIKKGTCAERTYPRDFFWCARQESNLRPTA